MPQSQGICTIDGKRPSFKFKFKLQNDKKWVTWLAYKMFVFPFETGLNVHPINFPFQVQEPRKVVRLNKHA